MTEIAREINAILAARRKQAQDDLEKRKAEVFDKIPELNAIEEEIALSGIRFAKSLIRNSSAQSASDDFSARISRLKNDKMRLLSAHGYKADYLEPHYVCPLCRDTGTIRDSVTLESGPCSCYRQLYLERLYRVSNLLSDGGTGFEFFQESYYSDTPDRKRYDSDLSPRAQIKSIREHCFAFIEGFNRPETPNLYFFGSAGTGKTFMAKSVGLELIKQGVTVLYLSAPTLFEIIRRARFSCDADEYGFDSSYNDLIGVQLLILDDLGTEPASDARFAEFLTLLEARRAQSRHQASKMIIASNLNMKLLYQMYHERIASRIAGEFDALKFFGDDIRIIKKYA